MFPFFFFGTDWSRRIFSSPWKINFKRKDRGMNNFFEKFCQRKRRKWKNSIWFDVFNFSFYIFVSGAIFHGDSLDEEAVFELAIEEIRKDRSAGEFVLEPVVKWVNTSTDGMGAAAAGKSIRYINWNWTICHWLKREGGKKRKTKKRRKKNRETRFVGCKIENIRHTGVSVNLYRSKKQK